MLDDPMVFRPPARRRGMQLALGIPLSLVVEAAALFAVAVLWLPHGIVYEVGEGRLAVTYGMRPFERTKAVPLDRIATADLVHPGRGRKVMGTNLPGYCEGRFSYRDLGDVWQATDCSRAAVLVRLAGEGRPWLLSPPDPPSFLAALQGEGTYRRRLEPVEVGGGFLALKLLMLLLLPLSAMVPLVFLVAPGRLLYRVVPGGLQVTTILRTRRFETLGAAARRHSPRPGVRLFGTGMPGYFTGWFLLDGKRSRVYATGFDDGVLLEGQGLRLFVNPSQAEPFLLALRSTAGVTSDGT
jgi:hypothetical protein